MTTLNVNLTPTLQATLQQPGVWAYAVYFDSNGDPHWTAMVSDGAVASSGTVAIDLPEPFDGGKVYFLIQSQDSSQPYDLETLITSQSDINWDNAATWSFRYDSFEVTLKDASGDVGNLTSVVGFGLPMEISVPYSDGSTATRGYGISGEALFTAIKNIDTDKTYVYTYPLGPLSGDDYTAISPSQAVGLSPPNPAFSPDDWDAYIQSLEGAQAQQIIVAGFYNGAADNNNIYHNPGFFSYQLSWDATDSVFWLSPTEGSQIQGYIRITPDNLANSIYSTLGTVEIYTDPTDSTPYTIYQSGSTEMDEGANNQWSEVLTQFLTGFTAGFYGTAGLPANGLAGGTVDLNVNWNWDPSYAFGQNLSGSAPVYMDPYSQIFYFNSNSYGSGYSDNLMKQYSVGGPLISVWDPGTNANVSTINITIFDDSETPTGYVQPVIYNYISPDYSSYTAYQTPVWNGDGTTVGLAFVNQFMILDETTPITLEIYTGETGGTPTWAQVTLDPGSGSLWQIWDIGYDSGTGQYSVTATGTAQPTGNLLINQFPKAENGVAWYRLTVGSGDISKTYNFYTITENGQLLNPNYAGQAGSLAVDGLALITPQASTATTIGTFNLGFLYSGTTSLPPELLVQNTDASFVATLQVPNAPVAGTLAGDVFTAIAGQDNQVSNSITVSEAQLAYGWTAYNSAAGTPSWISGYTNKTGALNIAQINIQTSGGTLMTPVTTQADIDGQWLTALAPALGNGTYTVTMTQYVQGDSANLLAPASSVLTVKVDVDEVAIGAVGDYGIGFLLEGGGEVAGGNWIRLETVGSTLPQEVTLLLYAVNDAGERIGRDGQIGPDVSLEDATLATLGSVPDDQGVTLINGSQSVYLPAGYHLRFAVMSGNEVTDESATVDILAQMDGSLVIGIDGIELTAYTDNTLSAAAALAGTQRTTNEPWLYLQQGDTLDVQVAGSCANTNTLAFVRIDVDPLTGDWSVGGVAYGDTDAFYQAVRDELDSGFLVERGGAFNETTSWTVSSGTGYYAPVLLTQSGQTFVSGNASRGYEYIKLYGENTFGFEDLAYGEGSDFDFNDMIVKVTPTDDLFV